MDPRLLELAQMPLQLRAQRIAELFSEGAEDVGPRAPGRLQRRAARKNRLAEKPARIFGRRARALIHWLAPSRLPGLTRALVFYTRDKMTGQTCADAARITPEGFCGRAASLAPDDLLEASVRGMAPRSLLGLPMLWSPAFHAVLRPSDFPRGLGDRRSEVFGVSLDEAFDPCLSSARRKIARSASIRRWIWRSADLYDAGYAHSVEVWDRSGNLIAGLIGVAAGGVFTIERIHAESDEAFVRGVNNLAMQLQRWNFSLIDFGAPSPHSERLRCAHMSREAFCAFAADHVGGGHHGRWRIAADLRAPVRPAARPRSVFSPAHKKS